MGRIGERCSWQRQFNCKETTVIEIKTPSKVQRSVEGTVENVDFKGAVGHILFFFIFQTEQQVIKNVKCSFIGLVSNHARLLQQKSLYAGTAGDALLFVKMKTQQLAESAAVVVTGRFCISKSLKHETIAHDSVGEIQCIRLSIHFHDEFSYFLGGFCLASPTFAADDDAFAH
jgi:hypothetical protein